MRGFGEEEADKGGSTGFFCKRVDDEAGVAEAAKDFESGNEAKVRVRIEPWESEGRVCERRDSRVADFVLGRFKREVADEKGGPVVGIRDFLLILFFSIFIVFIGRRRRGG